LELLTKEGAAALCGVSSRTLERHMKEDHGPRPTRIGVRVLYDRTDVLDWLQHRRSAA
jgi:predicted DNA-binding transcriptional regulator AlpA